MLKLTWITQNDETSPGLNGFLLEDKAAFDAEVKFLTELGAPETDKLIFHTCLPVDRDESQIEAEGTEAFAEWMDNEGVPFEILERRLVKVMLAIAWCIAGTAVILFFATQ